MAVRRVQTVDIQSVAKLFSYKEKKEQVVTFLQEHSIALSSLTFDTTIISQLQLDGLFVKMNYCIDTHIPYSYFKLDDLIDESVEEILLSFLIVKKRSMNGTLYQ